MADDTNCPERKRGILDRDETLYRPTKLYFFIDLIIITTVYYLSYIFKCSSLKDLFTQNYLPDIEGYSFIFLLWLVSMTIFFKRKGLYATDKNVTMFNEVSRVAVSLFWSAILAGVAIFFLKYKFFSRRVFLQTFFISCVLLGGWRAVVRLMIKEVTKGTLPRLESILTNAVKICRAVKRIILDKIDGTIRLFLYLLIAVLPFSKAGVEICSIAAISLWIIKRLLLERYKPEDSVLNGPIYAFIAFGFISVLTSISFNISLHAFFSKFLEVLLLYFIIIETIKLRRHIFIILILFLSTTAVVCVDGFVQRFITGVDIFRRMPIVMGGITAAFNHKNDLAGYLLFPLPLVLFLALGRLYAIRKGRKIISNMIFLLIHFILLCLFSSAIFLTDSKGAWLALLSGVIFLCLFLRSKIAASIFIFCCLVGAAFILSSTYSIFQIDFGVQEDAIARVYYWKDALTMIAERPFFGKGINTYMQIVAKMHDVRGPSYAHNCFLQIAAEMGIIGLGCFLWIMWKLLHKCSQRLTMQISEDRFLLVGLLCGLTAFLAHSLVDTNLYSLQLNALFWYMIGLTVCIYKQQLIHEKNG